MRILAAVILYHPDLELLRCNLKAFARQVDGILVWDNSPLPVKERNAAFLSTCFPEAVVQGTGDNLGISHGLNQAWHYAKAHQYDTLLTMDQDSVFTAFPAYKAHVERKWQAEGLCLCGPSPNTADLPSETGRFQAVPDLITSGMLVPVPLLDRCGGYCPLFRVDGIDVELCYHLRELGTGVFQDLTSNLTQRYGEPTTRRLFGKTLHSPGYSPGRLYGIFRNHLIIWRRYHHPPRLLWKVVRLYLLSYTLKGILLVENGKREKLLAVCRGIRDGLTFHLSTASTTQSNI